MAETDARGPWRLLPNRVGRFYRGGLMIDELRGEAVPHDSDRPEDWVGSATRAWTPPGSVPSDEGLGEAELQGGTRVRVADVLEADPAAIAGEGLIAAAGIPTSGVLVKFLDAGVRLPVHAHPDREFARRHLGSFFGKAEAWIVLATRDLPGEPAPHVRLGFRRDVGRDELRRWIDEQHTKELLAAMHSRPAAAGEVWFIPPGTPHAIGAGLFILEVQEPTDFSIVAETRGFPVDTTAASVGLGWDVAIDAFDRRGLDDVALERLRVDARPPAAGDRPNEFQPLLPEEAAPFFRAFRVRVEGLFRPELEPAFLVGIVTDGGGVARTTGGELTIARGSTFGVPASELPGLELEAPDGLTLVACLPPRPADLAAGAST